MTRNLTIDEIKNVFLFSRREMGMPDNEDMPDKYIQLASYCSRNGIEAFCRVNKIELPVGWPLAHDDEG